MTYIPAAEYPQPIAQFCFKHGLKELSSCSMHPLKGTETHAMGGEFHLLQTCYTGNTAVTRLHRSLENLHWTSISDASVYSHFRSGDSDFILHCRQPRYKSGGGTLAHSMAEISESAMERATVHKDLARPPICKVQQWLLPTGDNKASPGGAKRDLKEKLRTHSSKIAEPHRPVRPLTYLSSHTEEQQPLQQHISSVPCIPALTNSTMPVTRQCTSTFHYRTSHEYIKQEAFRRLQLRRQNSSPNLTLHQGEKENRGMVKSKTSESFREQRQGCGKECELGVQERKHSSLNRLYIPTFEEFKKMRNKEKVHLSDTDTKYFSNGKSEPEKTLDGSLLTNKDSPVQRLDIWPVPSVSHGNHGPVGAVNFNGLSKDNCVSKVMQNSKRLSTGDFYSVVVQKSADLSTRNCNSSGLSNSNHTSMEAQSSSEFSKRNQDLFSTGNQDSMVAQKSTSLSPVDFYSMVVQKSAGLSTRNHVQNSTCFSIGGLSTGFSSGHFDSMLMHKYTSFSTRNCHSTSVQSSSDVLTRNHVSKEVQSPTGLSTEDCDSGMLQNATENHDTLVVKNSTYLFPTNHDSVLVQNSTAQSTGNEDSMVGQHLTDLSSESYHSTVVQKPTGLSSGNENSMVVQNLTGLSTGSHDFVVMQNSSGLSMGNDDSMAVQNSTGSSIGSHDSTDCMNKVSPGLSHGRNGSIQESTFVLSVMNVDLHQIKLPSGGSGNSSRTPLIAQHDSLEAKGHSTTYSSAFPAPICSSPSPRFPLQSVTLSRDKGELVGCEPFVSNGNSSNGFPNIAGQCITSEPPSCCPSLLLEATDLSGYSAKLQKMKDGLIGSALDLIKKSCSAESTVESPTKVSCDLQRTDLTSPEKSNRSSPDTMATPNSATVGSNEMGADTTPSLCGSACRRSSSDMTHETVETGKTPRGCRLRPHFSDPMPTDAVKRKQLELKIAAAARHHAQRRRQDKDNGPVLMKANTTTSCISEKETNLNAGHRHRSRHRWSNISSLSTDSGIVGVNDEKEEGELTMGRATKPAEVERADSGIGDAFSRRWRTRVAEASASLEAWEAHRPCTDCGERDLGVDTENRGKRRETLCTKCLMHRMERKEAIMEFVNTEASYGEDLKIIKEEFYIPMQSAGLLTHEQLLVIFTNIQELICLNEKFVEVLQEEIDQAFDQGDDDLITVCLGEVFLEFVNMLPAFQTYCLQHSASVTLLNALEKEKELLRIFLDVSQNDNTALRRMNLRSFLITPLQRVTKYPLLLSRILKSTTEFHPDHSSLWEAKSRIESHLEHINMKTKQEGNSWTIRSFRRESKRTREVTNIEMKELAIKQVGWPREDTRFIKEGALQLAQPTDGQWIKKGCKALKFQNVQALLMVNIRRVSESSLEASAAENPTVRDAVLVLIKDKSNGKFVLFREPLKLSNCVVSVDPDCDDTFELLEIRRDGLVLRDGDISRTHHWYQQLKIYSGWLGTWKRRRNALPNIMISTAQSRS
ncbi:uncharacterized protein LOC108701252 [Xenopus laevis]|uniref:Uncharacterized protein LOC108701252 n=2 Tax=Xenopus laevis TaxID=8355 RepID=A0A1L8EVA0_XENLA|nr:uncharacterized protein LOC108701252 [Xenopus laevis]OCT63261.1 hypothetical protein XELAEV_18044359mg [Xenopus laevis]